MTDPGPYLFWITSRAAGTAALVLSSVTVGYGLTLGTGIGAKLFKTGIPDRRNIHQVLSLAVLVAIAVHGVALLGDTYLRPTVLDIALPFVFSYKTLATSIGIVTAWTLAFLGLSYYARRWIGLRRWKLMHRFTALAWLAGLVHAFTEGSDAGQLWFIALVVLTAAPALALLVIRLSRPTAPRAPAPSRPRRSPGRGFVLPPGSASG